MKTNGTRRIKRRMFIGLWITMMVLFITELLVYTWSRVQCVRVGYEISNETGRQKDLIAAQKHLKIELARLKSPNRISHIATDRLQMAPPAPEQIISIQ